MKLQTKFDVKPQGTRQIGYSSKILALGSCFVENIGEKLSYFKFTMLQNPFGILFHPISIEKFIKKTTKQIFFTKDDLFFINEQWHCFDAHSRLSHVDKLMALNQLNIAIEAANSFLKNTSHLIITLGTARVYRYKKSGKIVANCHKVPQNNFTKELLSVEQVSSSLQNIIKMVRAINPNLTFIFTVSPVRHLRDGFIENTRSKSHLLSALHQVIEKEAYAFYFPSYEIMMDELRDYRFYAEDMVHPSPIAINYVWEKFKKAWIDKNYFTIMDEVDTIQKGLAHRPIHPEGKQHLAFKEKLLQKMENLTQKVPAITW